MRYKVLLNKKIVSQIKENSTILEFGPAEGQMTQYLQENLHCKVYIIEKDAEAFENAKKYAKDGLCDDIMSFKWVQYFSNIKFDYIIFADVLEHLIEPQKVVSKTIGLLKDTGYLLVSIPNIAHNDVLLNLYNDHFDYTLNGILDETHVHFWGRENLHSFFESAGYAIVAEAFNSVRTLETEQNKNISVVDKSVLNNFLMRPYGEVYQFVITCQKKDKITSGMLKEVVSKNNVESRLYLDFGQGYSEDHVISVSNYLGIQKKIKFNYRFHLKSGVQNVRFDPVDGEFCIVKGLRAFSDFGEAKIKFTNGFKVADMYLFENVDSQFEIEINRSSKYLDIEAEILSVSTEVEKKLLNAVIKENLKLSELQGELNEVDKKRYKAEEQNKMIFEFIDSKLDSALKNQKTKLEECIANQTQKIFHNMEKNKELNSRELMSILEEKNNAIGSLEVENDFLEKELNETRDAYQKLFNQYGEIASYNDSILNSTCWKITYPIRKAGQLKKRYTNAIKSLDSSMKYNIEEFSFDNSILSISGWIGAKGDISEYSKIVFCSSKNKENLGSLDIVLDNRLDVKEIYGLNGKGFKIKCKLEFNEKMDLLMEIQTGDQKHTITIRKNVQGQSRSDVFRVVVDSNHRGDSQLKYLLELNRRCKENSTEDKNDYPTFDIIIPVYNGLIYFDELFKSISKTTCRHRLIIINDNSSEEGVEEYLNTLAKKNSNTLLLKNEENLGFVKSVNRGLGLAKNHVIILNTDVILPANWIERLMRPIMLDAKVASTTPFTNCGTICGFPNFGVDNEIFDNLTVDQIDSVFLAVAPQYPHMPTGVGFCMGINFNILKEIGDLDEKTFAKGYGEENDWCQRAIEKGYYNVQVDNLFVYHKHGGSFTSEEKRKLLQRNAQLLLNKHPNYALNVEAYCNLDPVRETREIVLAKLILSVCAGAKIFAFNHSLGGGATSYLKEKVNVVLERKGSFTIAEYIPISQEYKITIHYKNYRIVFATKDIKDITQLLREDFFDEIWINELVSYPSIYSIFDDLIHMKHMVHAQLVVLLHDLFFICPAINMITNKGNYCGLLPLDQCELCAKENEHNHYREGGSVSEYRKRWKNVLEVADRIIAFSENTAALFEKAYGTFQTLEIIPHTVKFLPTVKKNVKITPTFNIGLLGILNKHKGLEIVKSMLYFIEKNNLNIKIILIGECVEKISSHYFYSTGKYSRESLPKLVSELDIDMFFISSIWPETFSYTTSEIMQMNLPVASFDIGAPADRIKKYEKGVIIPTISASATLNELLKYYSNNLQLPIINKKVLFIVEYVSFASRYRVEHVKEQLSDHGINADIISIKDINKIVLGQYYLVVIYRVADHKRVFDIVSEAHRWNIKVLYDVDDFVFDYSAIKELAFLAGDEYKNFEEYCNNIYASMEKCDGYITSTVTLKNEIEKRFNKPIYIKRNMASMEMYTISYNCIEHQTNEFDESSKIYLGYFSGSKTHDADFSLIANVIRRLMEEDERINLLLGGCLEIPFQFDAMKKRIITFGFKDWRELPKEIAKVTINLMPLEDTLFNCCKSENKWMEAALVKVPTVMSYNEELKLVVEDRTTGFLCRSEEEWYNNIKSLIVDADLRCKIAQNAYEVVKQNYLTWSNLELTPYV